MSEEHVFIRHVSVDQTFSGVYYLESCYDKKTKNGNLYSDLKIRDKSGIVFARLWESSKSLPPGNFVKIEAHGQSFQNQFQIIVDRIEVCPKPQDMDNYTKKSPTLDDDKVKFEKYYSVVREDSKEAKDKTCILLLDAVFNEAFKKEFFVASGNDKSVYGCVGGLLAHTVKTTYLSAILAKQHNVDAGTNLILITAGLLHSLGATSAFDVSGCAATESPMGKMLGQNFYTLQRLILAKKEIEGQEGYNSETMMRIMHCVVSLDSYYIRPKSIESIILNKIASADMFTASAIEYINEDSNADMFTSFDMVTRREYFKGDVDLSDE